MSEQKKEKKMPANYRKANRCEKCGFRIRGNNHENGVHHGQGSGGNSGVLRRRY